MARSPHVDELEKYFAPHIRPGVEDDGEYSRARAAWRAHVREWSRAARISSSTLPAVASGAQHFIAAREQLDAGITALGGITAGRDPDPDPEKTE